MSVDKFCISYTNGVSSMRQFELLGYSALGLLAQAKKFLALHF